MQIPALQQDAVVRALGWTFIHSLWQGLLLAILAGLVVLLTKNARTALRYNLLVALVGLFLCGAAGTFIYQLQQPAAAAPAAASLTGGTGVAYPVNNVVLPVFDEPVQAAPPRFADRFVDYFNTHAPAVVLIWFVVFSAKLVRLLADIGYIQRIRRHKTYAPPGYWNEKVQSLAQSLQIRRHIILLQSALVQVPLVIGALKPVILVPLGILSQLPPGQVEAVLLHELAHIKRRDYLVNLLQSIAEIIFFFNPAVWWVSSLVRDERENCCDDIAVAGAKNKTAFLDALVSFQEYNNNLSKYGMAFPGRKNHLLNRVKRILHQKNKTLNTMEKSLLTFSIAIILLLTLSTARQVQAQAVKDKKAGTSQLAKPPVPKPEPGMPAPPSQPHLQVDIMPPPVAAPLPAPPVPAATLVIPVKPGTAVNPAVEPAAAPMPSTPPQPGTPAPLPPPIIIMAAPANPTPVPVVLVDTLVPAQSEFTHVSSNINDDGKTKTESLEAIGRDGKTYKISKLNNAVTSLSIDGVEIPKEKYADYQSLIDKLDGARDANWQKSRQKLFKAQTFRLERSLQTQKFQFESKKTELEKKILLGNLAVSGKKANTVRAVLVDGYYVGPEKVKVVRGYKTPAYQPVTVEVTVIPGRSYNAGSYKKQPLFTQNERKVGVLSVSRVHKITREGYDADELKNQQDLLEEMADELVKDGIIKNKKRLESMGLNDTEFIINGKKQPDDVQQKYRARFITRPGYGLFYGPVQMTGKGYFLGKDAF